MFSTPDYHVDVVFVIDATGGMAPNVPFVQSFVHRFFSFLQKEMKEAGKPITGLRARIVDFADYAFEDEDTIHQTRFFNFPDEIHHFQEAFRQIKYENRGGDEPENGLEALYYAMNSDWYQCAPGERGRHIVVLISDAYPLRLRERDVCFGYPAEEIPQDFSVLEEMWDNPQEARLKLTKRYKRLVLIVPEGRDGEGRSWEDVMDWPDTVMADFKFLINMSDDMLYTIVREMIIAR